MVKTSYNAAQKRRKIKPVNSGITNPAKNVSGPKASCNDPGPAKAESFPIVGIGASAGGLEAVEQLAEHLSNDTGMAFILIQHLSPDRESILAELITKKTKMPVVEVSDGMIVEKGHIYVIPPGMDMAILNGKLSLIARPQKGIQHMPIDYFLRSLADDSKDKAIGIILSGTATDGTLGLAAIKAAGGITFAQEPQSAKYDGMPRSAIAAGNVDFVLPPDKIAEELNKISLHPYLHVESQEKSEILPDDELHKIFILLRSATHVDFSSYKPTTIKRRIARRMALHRIEKLSQYVIYLQENPSEIKTLYQDMLIQVTSFFRDPKMFDALKTNVFPLIIKEQPQQTPIRIWVPGCSSGEEAYSIAICLSEYLADEGQPRAVNIFGTDLSEMAIEKARAGIYPQTIAENVSQKRLNRFFTKINGNYQINKNIRELCIFAKQDIVSDPPFSKMDIISCRNVMIYMGRELQKKIMPKFHYALKPDGFLMLGSSETVGGFGDFFKLFDKNFNIYSKKSVEGPPKSLFTMTDIASEKSPMKPKVVEHEPFDLNKEVERLILTQFTPSSVVVDSNFDIIQTRGNTGRFLELPQGTASLNLFKMARHGLALELRTALHDAKTNNAPVQKTDIRLKYNKEQFIADFEIIPITPKPDSKEYYYLIIFNEKTPVPAHSADVNAGSVTPATAQSSTELRRIEQLEKELETARRYLQSTIEEHDKTNEDLRSVSEEFQSSNEELQSTNEELETAKEELQSTNEELMTVNDELHHKNTELKGVNNDLLNLLASAQIPILIVDNDLHIRRFTAIAEKIFALIPGDIGRPLGDLKTKLVTADLESMIREVVTTLAVKELEVQDNSMHWWLLRVHPYKTTDNRIDGAVVALIDIEVMKLFQNRIEQLNSDLQRKNRELETIISAASHDIRAPLVNVQGFSQELVKDCESLGALLGKVDLTELQNKEVSHLLEDVKTSIGFIQNSAKAVDILIVNLLTVTKAGMTELTLKNVDMNSVFSELMKNLEYKFKHAGATISLEQLPPCNADEDQIKQVFSNIVDNAIKYLDPSRPGHIHVFGSTQGDSVIYCIEDNGVGIAEQKKEKIFEFFLRLDKNAAKGEGLGLAIVRRIVEKHRGRVWVESEVGKGSKFYVALPLYLKAKESYS